MTPGEFEGDPERSLDDLGKRLDRAKDAQQGSIHEGAGPDKEQNSSIAMAMRVGTELVAGLVVGAGIGLALDTWLETKPWFMIVFFFLGAAAGILNVFRTTQKMSTDWNEQENDKTGGKN